MKTGGRVVEAKCAAIERLKTGGRVGEAPIHAIHRLVPDGGVPKAIRVAVECLKTNGRVKCALRDVEVEQRILTLSGVFVRIATVRWGVYGSRLR